MQARRNRARSTAWPSGLPALLRALKLQKRAARVGFDWPSTDEVIDKIVEESRELVEARDRLTQAEVEEEFGDLLFVMANLGRHLGLDPEAALRKANAKFTRRFEAVEARLAEMGKTPRRATLRRWTRSGMRSRPRRAAVSAPPAECRPAPMRGRRARVAGYPQRTAG